MKIFERQTASEFKQREREDPTRPWGGRVYGMYIVFGDEDNFEERYYTTVPNAAMGVSEEDLRHSISEEEWDRRLKDLDLEQLKANAGRLLFKDLYPDFDPEKYTEFDRASQADPDRVFLKEKSLLVTESYDLRKFRDSKKDMLTELGACEVLMQSPHPNIVKYLGCRVQGNRVTGIYYERCIEIEDIEAPLKIEKYVEHLHKSTAHLHSLGYCHNDISPDNIMLKDDDTAVLVDFDACLPVGEKLGRRAWPPVGPESVETSEEENDWYGLRVIERWMHEWNERYHSIPPPQ